MSFCFQALVSSVARSHDVRELLYKPNTLEEFSEAIYRFAAKTWQS
jgi:hypothetical protein